MADDCVVGVSLFICTNFVVVCSFVVLIYI